MNIKKQSIAALTILSLALPATTTLLVTTSATPAYAKSGNGNGNGNSGNKGNGGGGGASKTKSTGNAGKTKSGGNGKGAVRSSLGGANASNASPTALEHASDNSRVGKARIFRDSYVAAETAVAGLGEGATAVYDSYGETGPAYSAADKQAAIDALVLPDPDGEYGGEGQYASYEEALADYAAQKALLEAERDAAAAYEMQAGVDDALMALTGGRNLTDEAMDELLANLGL